METVTKLTKARKEQLIRVCYHEAGHAIAAYFTELGVAHVCVKWGSRWAGEVDLKASDEDFDLRRLQRFVRYCLAGGIAERRYWGKPLPKTERHNDLWDLDLAYNYAWGFYDDEGCNMQEARSKATAYLHRQVEATERFVEKHWWAVEAIAQALLSRVLEEGVAEIKADEVREIIEAARD